MVSLTQQEGRNEGKITFLTWHSGLDLKVSILYLIFITVRLEVLEVDDIRV
jgi:hypothetical protein